MRKLVNSPYQINTVMRKEYDVLLEEYNTLSEEYNALSETYVTCEEHHDDLLEIYEDLRALYSPPLEILRLWVDSLVVCSESELIFRGLKMAGNALKMNSESEFTPSSDLKSG